MSEHIVLAFGLGGCRPSDSKALAASKSTLKKSKLEVPCSEDPAVYSFASLIIRRPCEGRDS